LAIEPQGKHCPPTIAEFATGQTQDFVVELKTKVALQLQASVPFTRPLLKLAIEPQGKHCPPMIAEFGIGQTQVLLDELKTKVALQLQASVPLTVPSL
jgi:tartrate dehydratase alpha subunit/fumarate hydratase class I-like protein